MNDSIYIRTERSGPGLIKVVWSDSTGARFRPYRLQTKWLAPKIAACRAALDDIRKAYLTPKRDFGVATLALAARGYNLRRALFEDCLPDDVQTAAEPKHWFDALAADTSRKLIINVHADPIISIPWGLIHDVGTSRHPADPYDDFWAVRYNVAALYSGMAPQRLMNARRGDDVRLLNALNETAYAHARSRLDPPTQNFVDSFFDRPVGRAYSSRGCKERWRQVGDSDCLIHFFGHATGEALHFSSDDTITASEFRDLFRRESSVVRVRTEPIYALAILNGCATLTGEDADSFLLATADPGFCGFIGAEAVVPDEFGLLFSQELLTCLLDNGLPVREAMSSLWRKHRPMSLFYGCYAHPNFTIAPTRQQPDLPDIFAYPNFCRDEHSKDHHTNDQE